MADIVFDANGVGQVVTYVAPGYLAYLGYRTRYPAPSRPAGEVLIISVVTSLPLVAAVQAALPGAQKPSQFGYIALLLGVASILGYVTSVVRGKPWAKKALARLGYTLQAEGTIYAQTLKHLSDDAPVTVELKDGRRISGCAAGGPQTKDDGVDELYLVYPQALDDEGEWQPVGGPGAIIPLSEVSSIVLSEEPTGASTA